MKLLDSCAFVICLIDGRESEASIKPRATDVMACDPSRPCFLLPPLVTPRPNFFLVFGIFFGGGLVSSGGDLVSSACKESESLVSIESTLISLITLLNKITAAPLTMAWSQRCAHDPSLPTSNSPLIGLPIKNLHSLRRSLDPRGVQNLHIHRLT